MKRINLLVLVAMVFFFSCGDDEGGNVEVNLADLTVTIDENPSDGQVVGAIKTDGGTGENFSITNQTPSGALSINPGTGELIVEDASLFDFETNPVISATVTASNADNTAAITINLDNVNEVTGESLEVTIDENPAVAQVIGTITADGGENFSITTQSPEGALSIDANSGVITVADPSLFDFEINPTITATVSIDDTENPVTVTINLTDVKEWSTQDLATSIDENPTDGQAVGTIQVSGSGTLSFSITSQTPADALSVDSNTGELSVVDPNLFDFEINPVITANILVGDGTFTATATATINLNDVDEVSAQNTNLTLDENPSNGDIIGALQVSGSNLTYAITFQNPAGAFNIDQNTGELSVGDETLFDFETNSNMLVTISVSNGTQTVSANAHVALNDVNEVGEFKYGGVIFWIDPASNNSSGLVCTVNDLNSGNPIVWTTGSYTDTGATGTAIGTGNGNTNAIVASQGAGDYAAWACAALILNTYSDWYLPSTDELNEMYLNRGSINSASTANGGANLNAGYYYTSTQYTNSINSGAYVQRFSDGLQTISNKIDPQMVRAIRSWSDL